MANREDEFTVEGWEADEYVICFNGKPVGQTLHKAEANGIKRWLGTALNDLQRPVTETLKEQLEKLTVIEDEEIREAKAEAERLYWTHKAHPSYEKDKYLLDRQLNHTKEQLRELLG